jgi:lipopolysaccharide export system protein LptC
MTEEADQIRSERQEFARPGGEHDRLIRWLAVLLPGAVGVIAALMILTPLSPRGEVSFLLDRNKVAVASERLRVDNAMYRGQDDQGRPFSLTAGQAVQSSSRIPVVHMADLVARILLSDGPAVLSADSGTYNFDENRVVVDGIVRLSAADGYRMVVSDVTVDLEEKTIRSAGRVQGAAPAGTFSADSIMADIASREVSLLGNARLSMVPGKLAMP